MSVVTQQNFTDKISPGINNCEAICIHHWGDPDTNPQFDRIVDYLAYSSAPVSAHFVLEDHRVAQLAGFRQIAWHCAAGNVNKNPQWIGIECNPRASAGDIESLAELIAEVWHDLGYITPIVKHSDAIATVCPGNIYSDIVNNGSLEKLARQKYDHKKGGVMEPIDVWNIEIPNAPGNLTPARVILQAIDEYTGKQPERVWSAEIENTNNQLIPVKLMLKAMDGYTGRTAEKVEAMEKQLASIEEKLSRIIEKL